MPHLPYSIELHDSELAAVEKHAGAAVLKLRPAYIHRDGKGWRQDADLIIGSATMEEVAVELPAALAGGRLKTRNAPYHNLLFLPLDVEGEVLLTLEFFSEAVLRVQGVSARVVLHGEPVYIENVADRLRGTLIDAAQAAAKAGLTEQELEQLLADES